MANRLAEGISRIGHRKQVDKNGHPYIQHIIRVVDLCWLHRLQIGSLIYRATEVAWLHDLLEDTDITAQELLDIGIEPLVVDSVQMLTRDKTITYAEYINRIDKSGDHVALFVKIQDLTDHLLNPGLPETLRPRYLSAYTQLTSEEWSL
jgi:(p)ppGpp synthase/HD superfamily hydrolase